MKDRCELSYNKNYTNATFCRIISDVDRNYDPVAFGTWLTEEFNESAFKSWQQVADALVGVRGATRSTLSRYAGAKPQHLTNQPSQPNVELVIALASLFNSDVNQALMLAGHAPRNPLAINRKLESIAFSYAGLEPDEQKQADYLIDLLDREIERIEKERTQRNE